MMIGYPDFGLVAYAIVVLKSLSVIEYNNYALLYSTCLACSCTSSEMKFIVCSKIHGHIY